MSQQPVGAWTGKGLFLALLILVLFCIVIFQDKPISVAKERQKPVANSAPASSPAHSSSEKPQKGSIYTFKGIGACVESYWNLGTVISAAHNKDAEALTAMTEDGRIFSLSAKTQVEVVGDLQDAVMLRVRSGKYLGKRCYLPFSMLKDLAE